jgi:hypothetical protein
MPPPDLLNEADRDGGKHQEYGTLLKALIIDLTPQGESQIACCIGSVRLPGYELCNEDFVLAPQDTSHVSSL